MDVVVEVCDSGSLTSIFFFFSEVRARKGEVVGKTEERRGDEKNSFGRRHRPGKVSIIELRVVSMALGFPPAMFSFICCSKE